MMLASLAIMEGELDRAESLLKELPEQCTDPSGIWVQLYLKQGKPLEALKATQRSLYISLTRALSCLTPWCCRSWKRTLSAAGRRRRPTAFWKEPSASWTRARY